MNQFNILEQKKCCVNCGMPWICRVCMDNDDNKTSNYDVMIKINELNLKFDKLMTILEGDKAANYRDDNWRNKTYKVCGTSKYPESK